MKTYPVSDASPKNDLRTSVKKKQPVLLAVLLSSLALGVSGCVEDGGPVYGPRYANYGPGYRGGVTVEIGDRPYYNRGPGYYVGRTYYVWRPGHWSGRRGHRVWIRGHYIRR